MAQFETQNGMDWIKIVYIPLATNVLLQERISSLWEETYSCMSALSNQ